MSPRHYTDKVKKELSKINKTIASRLEAYQLESIEAILKEWKSGKIMESQALASIQSLFSSNNPQWVEEGVDPGVPVAQAIVKGILSKDDLSEDVWIAMQSLLTLVEI